MSPEDCERFRAGLVAQLDAACTFVDGLVCSLQLFAYTENPLMGFFPEEPGAFEWLACAQQARAPERRNRYGERITFRFGMRLHYLEERRAASSKR